MSDSDTGARKPSLYIVDALNFIFRAFHALPPLTTTTGLNTNAVLGFAQMLLRIEREQSPTHLCVVFDGPGKNFRYDIYAAYKADRPPMPAELHSQMPLVNRVIDAFGIQTLVVPGFEADDVIATVTRLALGQGMEVVICSSDKDLMQLCREDVAVLDTMKNRRLGPVEVKEKFGVEPSQVGDVLALMGDGIDNVPGVDGIGPKTASELISRFGSLAGLYEHIGEVKGKKGEAIAAAHDLVMTSRSLVALRDDVPLPKTITDLHRVEPDRDRLTSLFLELEFSRLAEQINSAPTLTSPRPEWLARAGVGEAGRGGSAATGGSPAASDAEAAAPVPRPPPPPAQVILDAPALAQLAAAITAAGEVGLAVIAEGPFNVRADLVGIGFALPPTPAAPLGPRVYVPLRHRYLGAPACLAETEALAILAPVLALPAVRKHAHDGKTPEVLLRRRGIVLDGVASDSMIAAYLLDASRTRYDLEFVAAHEDKGEVVARSAWMGTGRNAHPASDLPVEEVGTRVAAEAAAALALAAPQEVKLTAAKLDGLYHDLELPLAHVLARIECRGIQLDVDYLRRLGQEVGVSLAALEGEIHAMAGQPFNINSNKQLADVLFGKLGLPVIRRTKTGASTDADTLEELAVLHPVPAKIVEFRALAKLKGTYIDALPALVDPATSRLHTSFNQAVAATGRLSSSDPNLQNIPIRSEVGRRIRGAFLAKPGHVIVSADYSQIELRILAHFSEDTAFLDAFRSGQDIHLRTAAEVFGVPPESVTAEHRRVAKAINFGLVFGQSDFGLSQVLRIPRAQARQYIDSYFARYVGVRRYMERAIADARDSGEVTTLLGRRRPLPEIRAARAQDRSYGERMARNTPIQGSAADLLKLAMIRVDAGLERQRGPGPGPELLLTVHDELVFEVPEGDVDTFKQWVKHEMESVYTLKVPLIVDVGAGPTWGDAH
ncbi:MAG TPA: DNA polymerase I [Polyangia bacterium]|nr:DNA polymerase I [Polyangia bacterium]